MRALALALAAGIASAVVHLPPRSAQRLSPAAEGVHAAVASLPPRARVLLSLDFGPGTGAENRPQAEALLRHLLGGGARVALVSLWATGPPEIERVLDVVVRREFPGLVYGEDFVNLGFQSGRAGAILALAHDFTGLFAGDAEGAVTTSFDMLAGVSGLADFDLVVAVGSGTPGGADWVRYGRAAGPVPLALAATASQATRLRAYWPGQIAGILGGLRDAVAYDGALAAARGPRGGEAAGRLDAQSIVLLVSLAVIATGPRAGPARRSARDGAPSGASAPTGDPGARRPP